MLQPRIVPCLLLHQDGLVKTIKFKSPNYVGDPVNVISIFNQFEVDEIVLLDIFATMHGRPPALEMLKRVANECMIPLTYGGGITSLEQMQQIFRVGVEKIVLNSVLATNDRLLPEAVKQFGSQSIVACMDVKPSFFRKNYQVYTHNGTRCVSKDVVAYARRLEAWGAGEIFLNAIHCDGTMKGFDLELIKRVTQAVNVPVVAGGGAGSRGDLFRPIHEAHASAVACGSLFIYQNQERGVLINFPKRSEIEKGLSKST